MNIQTDLDICYQFLYPRDESEKKKKKKDNKKEQFKNALSDFRKNVF